MSCGTLPCTNMHALMFELRLCSLVDMRIKLKVIVDDVCWYSVLLFCVRFDVICFALLSLSDSTAHAPSTPALAKMSFG